MQGNIFDDAYFSQVLRIISAPLPSPFIASLFAADLLLPDRVLGYEMEAVNDSKIVKYWGKQGLQLYRTMLKSDGHVVPIGVHKAWRSARTWEKEGAQYYRKMRTRCKYLH